jgi:hypothetical protein
MVVSMADEIAVINSVLSGVFVGVLFARFSESLGGTIAAGAVAALPVLGLHYLYNRRNWDLIRNEMEPRFASRR